MATKTIRMIPTLAVLALVAVAGFYYLNPGVRTGISGRAAIKLTVQFDPNPMPQGRPVKISAYVTTGPQGTCVKECHTERGTSPFTMTLYADPGEFVHLSAVQPDSTTTRLECWLHRDGQEVAHDLRRKGAAICEYAVVA